MSENILRIGKELEMLSSVIWLKHNRQQLNNANHSIITGPSATNQVSTAKDDHPKYKTFDFLVFWWLPTTDLESTKEVGLPLIN